MPVWLQILLGLLGAIAALLAIVRAENDRQTRVLMAEVGRTIAEHIAECPARSRAVVADDDSGEVHRVAPSPSTGFRVPG